MGEREHASHHDSGSQVPEQLSRNVGSSPAAVRRARREMSIFFEELLPRLKSIELAGRPQRTVTNFVGGPKSVPVKFKTE